MNKLSVVTITKNTADTIEKLVGNALQIGDEHVVVDTGSTDNTIEAAKRAGAKVVVYQGEFDYSSPRNLGIENATGDWIFTLDSDEYVDPRFADTFRKLIVSEKFERYNLTQINIHEKSKKNRVGLQTRLAKKHFRYKGLVYEDLFPYRPNGIADIVIINNSEHSNKTCELRRKLWIKELHSFKQKQPKSIEEICTAISRGTDLIEHAYLMGEYAGPYSESIYYKILEAYMAGCEKDVNNLYVHFLMGSLLVNTFNNHQVAFEILNRFQDRDDLYPELSQLMADVYFFNDVDSIPHAFRFINMAIDKNPCSIYHLSKARMYNIIGEDNLAESERVIARELMPEIDIIDRIMPEIPK